MLCCLPARTGTQTDRHTLSFLLSFPCRVAALVVGCALYFALPFNLFIVLIFLHSNTFSGNAVQTPRYDYNNIMYELDVAVASAGL